MCPSESKSVHLTQRFQNSTSRNAILKNLSIKIGHDLLLLLGSRIRVNIHRGRDIRVPHDRLDHLEVRLVLTEPCTESMPELMSRELRDQDWFSSSQKPMAD